MFTVSCCFFFFFKQKTAYEMRISDWSSDVCSSDLQVDLLSRRLDPLLRLLLEGMQNIDPVRELHRVDGAIGIAVIVIDYLEHASAAEPGERLGGIMLATGLGEVESVSHQDRKSVV